MAKKKAETQPPELSDDWHWDEPLAYLVKCFDTTLHEYRVFENKRDANDFADEQRELADDEYDGRVWPLYAGIAQDE